MRVFRAFLVISVLVSALVAPAGAGNVTGKVMFAGVRLQPKKIDMDEDPECAALHKTPVYDQSEVVNRSRTLANVFVYVKTGLEGKKFAPPATPVTIDQKAAGSLRACWGFKSARYCELLTPIQSRTTSIRARTIIASGITASPPARLRLNANSRIRKLWFV